MKTGTKFEEYEGEAVKELIKKVKFESSKKEVINLLEKKGENMLGNKRTSRQLGEKNALISKGREILFFWSKTYQ